MTELSLKQREQLYGPCYKQIIKTVKKPSKRQHNTSTHTTTYNKK